MFESRHPNVATLQIGPAVALMSDAEILELFNDTIEAQERMAASYHHVAVEIPEGQPQVEYFEKGYHWVPRGDVLRCIISDTQDGEVVISIDDREFPLEEFGRMLCVYAGWGMRICFVPEDELTKEPDIEVREPRG